MKIRALKNPAPHQIAALIASSKHKAAHRIEDEKTGDVYVWDAAEGTHAEGAAQLGLAYSRPPGAGDILVA